jgi:ADP-ribosylglycohydrolase
MFPPYRVLREQLRRMERDRATEGRDTTGISMAIERVADDYQAMADLAQRIDQAPQRDDWPYVEPDTYEAIVREQSVSVATPDLSQAQDVFGHRAQSGFLGSVVGCILGKPVEIMPTLDELRSALESIGEWPLNDFIPARIAAEGGLRHLHKDAPETVRENIHYVAADDDINYTLLGTMTLEKYGLGFTKRDLCGMWLDNLPIAYTWGPERGFLTKMALAMGVEDAPDVDLEALADTQNPLHEYCGALIRAQPYGYAAAGQPRRASELAWRDASMTHRGNGIYGSMFAAAAIAAAFTATDPMDIFTTALGYIPRRSRLHEIVTGSLEQVQTANDWIEGYQRIHGRYGEYGNCAIFQEIGTVINTLRFARDVGHGVCIQVSQGNDTDSFGALAGALLGVHFGPGHLEPRWLEPFNDRLQTRLAGFYDSSLSSTAHRVAALTRLHHDD